MSEDGIVYLQPFRLPSDHAHGIQILNTCRALAEAGATVRLPVKRNPARPCRDAAAALAAYGLDPHPRLAIEWRLWLHKMRDIRDVYAQQPVSVLEPF